MMSSSWPNWTYFQVFHDWIAALGLQLAALDDQQQPRGLGATPSTHPHELDATRQQIL